MKYFKQKNFLGQGDQENLLHSEYKLNPSVLIENILKREKCVEPCTRDGPFFKAGMARCGVKDLHCVQVDKVAVHHNQLLMKKLVIMVMSLMILLTMTVMKTKTHMLDILEVEKLDRSKGGQTEQPEREDDRIL